MQLQLTEAGPEPRRPSSQSVSIVKDGMWCPPTLRAVRVHETARPFGSVFHYLSVNDESHYQSNRDNKQLLRSESERNIWLCCRGWIANDSTFAFCSFSPVILGSTPCWRTRTVGRSKQYTVWSVCTPLISSANVGSVPIRRNANPNPNHKS